MTRAMLLTCLPLLMTTVMFSNCCGLVGDPHTTHCHGLVGDPHAISSCHGLVGDPHMLNSIHGLVNDPQDSLALSTFFKTSQVDLFVSVCFVVPYFLVGNPRHGIG